MSNIGEARSPRAQQPFLRAARQDVYRRSPHVEPQRAKSLDRVHDKVNSAGSTCGAQPVEVGDDARGEARPRHREYADPRTIERVHQRPFVEYAITQWYDVHGKTARVRRRQPGIHVRRKFGVGNHNLVARTKWQTPRGEVDSGPRVRRECNLALVRAYQFAHEPATPGQRAE